MNIASKLTTTIVAGAAAFLISKVVDTGWEMITGEAPPTEEDDDGLLRLVLFVSISAAAVAVAQRFALRGTNRFLTAHTKGQ